MKIVPIDNLGQFDRLKSAWDAAYSADPHATIFTSWPWLRGWLEMTSHKWLVLAFSPNSDSQYAAFLPLSIDPANGVLRIAGNSLADHTGFICLPDYSEESIAQFAKYIQCELQWDRFLINEIFDERIDLFLKCFSEGSFDIQEMDSTSCPYIPLPSNWDQYLQDFLGRNTRRNIRRSLTKIKNSTSFHMTHVNRDNLETQIDTLLELWQLRFGIKSEQILNRFRMIFRNCFENDRLRLDIYWNGEDPIAAIVEFVDTQKGTLSAWIMGYDAELSKQLGSWISPGKMLAWFGIRYAIKNRLQTYDFLRGDEPYKFSLGAKERFNRNVTITRKNWRVVARRLKKRIYYSLLNKS